MIKKISFFLFIFLLFNLILPSPIKADRGMIPIKPKVELWESDQNVILAWNGKEEILILSVNLKASEKTEILSLLPLPSNPLKIEEENFETFQKLVDLINEKLPPLPGFQKQAQRGEQPPAVLTFHEKIGAHDISVVKINDLEGFLKWDYLSQIGIRPETIDQDFKLALRNYLQRGIIYFAFDKIEVGNKDVSLNPILYHFQSDYFYYPIKLTAFSSSAKNPERITDQIHLFAITQNPIKSFPIFLPSKSPAWSFNFNIILSQEELKGVSEKIAQLFNGNIYFSELRYTGNLAKATNDIIFYPPEFWRNNLKLGMKSDEVLALQKILINQGFWQSDCEATGYFGPITKRAVIRFQEEYRNYILEPLGLKKGTGFVGPKTREFLKQFQVQ